MSETQTRRVLIVEDEWLVRMELVGAFEDDGWQVFESASAEDAIAVLRGQEAIDLLITDIRLGGLLTGWDVAEQGRALRAALPVIYVSANPAVPDRNVPGAVFIDKPALTGDVIGTAQRLIEAN